MKTWQIILIAYALCLIICFAIMIADRLKHSRDKLIADIGWSFIASLFFPVVIWIGVRELYYRNRPRPVPADRRNNIFKDRVEVNGEIMSISKYNTTHKRQYTLEQVYGREYVENLTEEDISKFETFEDTMDVEPGLPDGPETEAAVIFARAFLKDDFSPLLPHLSGDIRMLTYQEGTLKGQIAFLSYWKEERARLKKNNDIFNINVIYNEYCGHAIVNIRQDGMPVRNVIFKLADEGSCTDDSPFMIELAVNILSSIHRDYVSYHSLSSPKFDYEFLMKGLEGPAPSDFSIMNRMPCLECGRASEELEWHECRHDLGQYILPGIVSVCPHCKTEVEFLPGKPQETSDSSIRLSDRLKANADPRISPVLSPLPYLWNRSAEKNDGERLFKKLWSDGDYDGAYALISDDEWLEKNGTIALMWNAAVLIHGDYLSRGLVNIASAEPDRDRARTILECLVSEYDLDDLEEMDKKILDNAKRFLREFDDVSFLTFLSGMFVLRLQAVENGDGNVNIGRKISTLGMSATVDDGYDLKVMPASDKNGFGSLSSLYVQDESEKSDEIFRHIKIQRTPSGAWMAYMLSVAPTLMRYFWHGGYERRKYILNQYDLSSLFDGEGIVLGCKNAAEIIHPKVTFDGDTAFVECCYWNDWKGLVKERSSVTYDGDRGTQIKRIYETTLYEYNCGIRF